MRFSQAEDLLESDEIWPGLSFFMNSEARGAEAGGDGLAIDGGPGVALALTWRPIALALLHARTRARIGTRMRAILSFDSRSDFDGIASHA